MSQGIGVVGLYVRDQDEAIEFYVDKLGFRVHTDARNGDYRWLTVQHPGQPSFQLGLFAPQAPLLDAATVQMMRELVAKQFQNFNPCANVRDVYTDMSDQRANSGLWEVGSRLSVIRFKQV
ncbi:glyoxalase/bleomycin resistance protein/dioxygenase superfamily protein [Nitrosomonas oligotropha]|uniref:Glyoxalase/bleomycin resistance protein/dioxygenase superfamily protein n=1 Tax=Nitrosomonas oligotropha TaxID=42354 RepID=A0A2T5HKE0_9PROT|nr:VOC family protein [Nitrosomonas oligotropha]PTQ72045.1 glyoxalase/bleomycin resistance protein/dioxygenase superfamily protein [Nitrosomonas oligotropha]